MKEKKTVSINSKMIRCFKLYNIFSSFLIFIPVLVLIYNKRGITASEVLIIESFYNITIALFEIPTGYLGDKLGHDVLVVVGLAGTVLSYILFAFSNTLLLIIISQMFYNNVKLDVEYMGVVYCVSSILGILFSISKKKFNTKMIYMVPFLFVIPIINRKIMVIPFVILLSYLKAMVYPFIQNYIASKSQDRKAFSLSASNMINNCINGVLMLVLSGLVGKFGFAAAMGGLAVLVAFILLWLVKGSARALEDESI